MRTKSLIKDGEFGEGNLIFKEIRRLNILDDLRDLRVELESKELSLNESDENIISYKGFNIEKFCYINVNDNINNCCYVIQAPGYYVGDDKRFPLPLRCHDKNGNIVEFNTLNDVKNWIDTYDNVYEIMIQNNDEIHAVIPSNISEAISSSLLDANGNEYKGFFRG